MTSQRDRLLGRPLPSVPYRLLVDPDGVAAAQRRLAAAQTTERRTRVAGTASAADQASARLEVEAAAAELDACYETVTLSALEPRRVEELIDAHPPTAEQMAAAKAERDKARQRGDHPPDWPTWNPDTFLPALLEASAAGDMTAADWDVMLTSRLSVGESVGLRKACLGINMSARMAEPVVLPKGWMPTIS